MCQAKPGPRCSPHARQALAAAHERLAAAEAAGDPGTLAAAQRAAEAATVDYASTPEGGAELRAGLDSMGVLGTGPTALRVTTTLAPGAKHVTVAAHDGTGREVVRAPAPDVARGVPGLSGDQEMGLSALAAAVDAQHRACVAGDALDGARRDQVALMPPVIARGGVGHRERIALGAARDELAAAEAGYGAYAALGRPVPADVVERVRTASGAVREADRAARVAVSGDVDAAGLQAMPAHVRDLFDQGLAAASAGERERMVGVSHAYAADRQWATFDRVDFGASHLRERPAAPWVRHTRPLADADFARLSLIGEGAPVEVSGAGLAREARVSGGARHLERLWAGGYRVCLPREDESDAVVMGGPNLGAWAAAERAAARG